MNPQDSARLQVASPPATPIAIEAKRLGRRYGTSWALAGVDLVIPRGTTMLVAGRNGSGKSTLFRVLAGALSPDMGTLRIEGCDAMTDRTGLRRQVALLTHHTFAYEALTAFENLRVTARLLGQDSDRKRLVGLLDEMGIGKRADDMVKTFSAGMRKRLAFARVLIQKPAVVLLDEPYAQLDPQGLEFVDALVPRLRAAGSTVLVAEHLLERGAEICERGMVLDRGRITWSGAARDLPSQSGLSVRSSTTRAA